MDVRFFDFLARQPSAKLTERSTFCGLPKRGLALILANAMFWQPLLVQADGIAVSGTTNTTLGQAGNGVPIVNIAAPNASGLSHNQYQQYNVGAQGVILNNATNRTQSTQLGGIIVGNQNLNGRAASTILNEVTGANATQLKGYTEVAGQAARVIVANPYGISCNGCGFINTPQVTLTTGRPVFDSAGGIDRFHVDGGSVSIDGQGLNADNVDRFDIITRSAKINAELHAKQLNIVTGRNDVNAQTLKATPLADDGSAKPQLAIDSSALGGMYAGAIRLVGTEAGIGVKLAGNLAASAGDIQIDANGQLSMAQVAANGAVNVKAASAEVQGAMYGSSVDVQARDALNIQQNIAARDRISLSSNGQLTNNAIVEAGVNADNSRNAAGDVALNAQNLRNAGSVTASRALQATVAQTLNNQGGTLSSQASLQVSAAVMDNRQSGRMLSQGSTGVTAAQVLNAQNGLISSTGLTINANLFDNRQQGKVFSTAGLSATITGQMLNGLGLFTANGNLQISAGELDNRGGTVRGNSALSLNATNVANDGGSLTSAGSLSVTAANAVSNQGGELLSDSALVLKSLSLDNSTGGRLAGAGVAVQTGAFDNHAASLTSSGRLQLTAQQVNNSQAGRIASALGLSAFVTGLDQRNGGRLYGNGDVTLDLNGGLLDNRGGLITAPGQLLLKNLNQVSNQAGEISSAKAFSFTASDLQNDDGSLISDQSLVVRVNRQLSNLRGEVSANGLDVHAGTLLNDGGRFSSQTNLDGLVYGAMSNRNGEWSAAGNATLSAASLDNAGGDVGADQRLSLNVSTTLDNRGGTLGAAKGIALQAASLNNAESGAVVTDGDLGIVLTGELDNHDAGSLQSKGALSVQSLSLDNRAGRLSTQGALALRSGSVDNRAGVVRADHDMQLFIDTLTNSQQGLISGKGGIAFIGEQLNNQSGLISASGLLQLQAASVQNDTGRISSQSDLTARIDSLTQQGGELVAQGDLNLTGSSLNNEAGGLVGANGSLNLNVTRIDNRGGELSSQRDVVVTSEQLDNSDAGKVIAGTGLSLTVEHLFNRAKGLLFGDIVDVDGQSLDNSAGTVAGQNGVRLDLSGDWINKGGAVSSEADLEASTASLDNALGSVSSAGAVKVTAVGGVNNQGGSISTDSTLDLTSASLDNRNQGLISAKGAVAVTTGDFDNSHSGQLTSTDRLTLETAQLTNRDGARIAAARAITANVTGLDQQGGQLYSNGTLSLDLNHGLLNNQNGLINSPGTLLLKNLSSVQNQHGEISSGQGFSLMADHFDNSGGKLISDQALIVRVAQALDNVKGVISGASLDAGAADLDNTQGLLSSHGDLSLTVDNALNNHNATLIADGKLLLNAASVDNGLGQIASKQDLIANIGGLQQQGGQFIALGSLSLTGTQLDNRQNGLLSANGLLNLNVANVDNRGGEISTQDAISLTAQQLDNSDAGRVVSQKHLALTVDQLTNRNAGVLSGNTGLSLTGTRLDNSGGHLLSLQNVDLRLNGDLLNNLGLLSSEGTLSVRSATLTNNGGSLSSAAALNLDTTGAITNQGGKLVTDGSLNLDSASLDNTLSGSISGKGPVAIRTGAFDNSHNGRVSSADSLELTAAQLSNGSGGSIGSNKALTAGVSGLDQQGGTLFSNASLTLDLNHGLLNNQGGLINAPGALLLKNLAAVNNRNGEISSAQGFAFNADSLDNSNGKLLSNQALIVRVAQALTNVKGMIAAASLDARSGTLDNSAGTLTSRGDLTLTVDGLLNNGNDGLINAAQTLNLRATGINNVGGTLLGTAALNLDLNGADLDNSNGLITTQNPLTVSHLRDLKNAGGEISSSQSYSLTARTLDNSNGKLISNGTLTLTADSLLNQSGLISGWQGLTVSGGSLDNRNGGTLSSRSGDLGVALTGALLNTANGALVSQKALNVTAASLDNRGGILSSGAGQTYTVSGLLDNGQNGLIDSGAALTINADQLGNAAGTINAQQALSFTGTALDNSAGSIAGNAGVSLDLLGNLTNTNGKLASAGDLLISRAAQVNNQGGQLASQRALTLFTGALDNRNRGTVAANDSLLLTASGAIQNGNDGLIYSKNAGLTVQAASLANGHGTVQSQGALNLTVTGDIDSQAGKIIAQGGDLNLTANNVDNRGGVLSSLQNAFTARITGVLKNGYDLARNGGITQAQRLDIRALAGIDNYGGRVSAQSGDALINTGNGNFDNRNGGLYAKQKISVTGNHFDNSGDNDGQIAGQQIDLDLAGALNNRLGIIESDSTLSIKAASVDNQTGKIRALGTGGVTQFQIGGLFDNRNGTLETANTDLALGVGNLLNAGGSVLHVGSGNFGISTANVMNAGGSFVTRGALTLNADSWTNSSVLQAGTLNVNVNNFTQTASGQLLASTALTGSGGNWNNDGLIASDGTLNLALGGTYSGNGRMTSLGVLGLGAGQLALGSAASIAGGARTDINVSGQANNYGRMTSAADMVFNAGAIANYGTLGAAQALTVTTPTLSNAQGLIFSGADMQLNIASLSNLTGDFYSLRNLTVGGYGTARANQVANVSGSMESGGAFSINATAFENRTQGSDGAQNFAVGRTLISGFIATQCLDCSGDHYSVNFVARETFNAGEDSDTSASALLTAGSNFSFTGSSFLNSKSTLSAGGNISIQADNVKNIGAVSGTVERTRTYFYGGDVNGHEITDGDVNRFMANVVAYNQRDNPNFPYVYYVAPSGELRLAKVTFTNGREPGHDGGLIRVTNVTDLQTNANVSSLTLSGYSFGSQPASQYDPNNLLALPAGLSTMTLVSDVEVAKDGTNSAGRSAVIQAGGNVSISATQDLQNSVIHEDYASAGGTNKVGSTQAAGTGKTVVVRLNAQLPPNLAQQQVDPTTLPGFSLPTGQNGLFRLSTQSGTDAAPIGAGSGSWTLTGASVSAAQREQSVPNASISPLRVDAVGQSASTSQQVTALTRDDTGVNVSTAALNTTSPTEAGNAGVVLPVRTSEPASATSVGAVPRATASDQATAVLPTVGSTTTQSIAKVQGLPSSAAKPSTGKYLIETNPVLTDLKQFMSSDYLLAGLGYDPDTSAKRLGDGLYEQRLVQQAVTARTGQAFIDGQTSNEDQFKYLMNNAIASKEQLNLSVGVSLTSEQVAALTHDIVWLEEHEVNGEKVLVPVLYLAQADNRLAPNGALIAGNDVTLIAGENLDNVGTLKATNNLSAMAGKDLVNSGLIQAGNRLDLLAGNDLTNKAGGIIAGRDVTLTAIGGDVTNERTLTALDSDARGQLHKDYVDNAARIEAANDLSMSAGRDINNIGSGLQSGRDMTLNAGRDVNLVSSQVVNSLVLDSKHTSSDITQIGSTVSAGRDLSVQAGRDVNAIATQIDAKRDIAIAATENVTIASAADEDHYLSKSKKLTIQEDHVSQVSTDITAAGSLAVSAGQNLAVISSRITAGDEAYLVAGDKLDILAAEDSDYSLYDKKKKGSFGKKKTKRDEVTQVTNIGSEITSGGNMMLVSGGDQHYQVAKLDSGKDLTLNSGGAIDFEGVKDLHQESHAKSNSSLAWNSMSGKGSTDETLRQSELIAKGNLAIKAVDGLHIDVKQVNQQTVSEAIDAMVQADPNLGWLKDAEKRGDVDWKLIKETHDAYKYSNSSLGQGAMLAIIIITTVLTAGAASGAIGTLAGAQAGAGTAMAAATTSEALAAGGQFSAAGWGNAMATAALTSMASTGAVNVINNKGNLGAALKETFSSEALKNAAISGMVAGFTTGVIDAKLGGTTKPFNSLTKGFDLTTVEGVRGFALHLGAQGVTSAVIETAVKGGSLSDNLLGNISSQAGVVAAAVGFSQVGDFAQKQYLTALGNNDPAGMALWGEGGAGRVFLHALMGGAVSAATGGDFATGAIAAGASQASAGALKAMFDNNPELRQGMAQIVGLTAAGLSGNDVNKAAWISLMADQYNRQMHPDEIPLIKKEAAQFAQEANISPAEAEQKLAKALVYYTDRNWNGLLTQQGEVPSELTLKYLGIALAPLAGTYAPPGGDIPSVGPERTYSSADTIVLLANYRSNHAAEYADSSINLLNLQSIYSGDLLGEYAAFYRNNLAVTPDFSSAASNVANSASGAIAGANAGFTGSLASAWAALMNPSAVTNGIMGLSKNPFESLGAAVETSQTKEALAKLYDMQGNYFASAEIRAQSDVEFALNFLPANRIKTLAELGALTKADGAYSASTRFEAAGGAKGGAVSSGAENAALYLPLKDQLLQENLSNIAAQDSRLAAAVNGSGTRSLNFSIGQGTSYEANQLGKIWVGDGAIKTSDGLGLISADGTRVYRPPTPKNSSFATTGVQANFETYSVNSVTGQRIKVSNGHLNVAD
ncbi:MULTISPECIES: filamentous hemagglutinin N-terminal domain-containing protein [unclassified Pseudomonas]|uniref:two-partner secretion domain-containing protein n=1 Tax=unclassified Pseudomonas TaxID=196821 RepID=UPI000D372B8B|nr:MULTISPECIES: filamentous hemagglutinin N-terminal domain-containing protein [unclassified Pseudomonas]RAU44642.1 filamentous hemagglutinin N-terminal domain-containing protein [Pseudomonas sp. RIT 409]RAU54922.1 filamentous hemagglutinin N-terminal domain-containing protein [Pseudomonas sp. RIT 412]